MILDRAILRSSSSISSSFQRLMKCRHYHPTAAAISSSTTAIIGGGNQSLLLKSGSGGSLHQKFSTDLHRLNEDNMIQHHRENNQPTIPKQEWTTFHGKIPVLQSTGEEAASTSPNAAPDNNNLIAADGSLGLGEKPRVSVLMELQDYVGVLHDVLKYFWKYDISVSRIESRPVQTGGPWTKPKFDFYMDFDGSLSDVNVQRLLEDLGPLTTKLLILDEKDVQWFPRHISELDLIAHRTLDAGTDLESDHPGFHDQVYRARREALAESAMKHQWYEKIPTIDYTSEETLVWTSVWDKMQDLWKSYACKEYLHSMNLLITNCGYSRDNIPQQQDISEFLMGRTNFRMRPVAGLLSSRDFLNGLAFRVFFCTQYIRHHSKPLYTPEPDICHELLGHAPMFADRDFADFSQEIGLASLGASDDDIVKLARCYWHSVEFGLCREDGKNKSYGAGLLSSFGELEYACSPDHPGADEPPEILDWDPTVASVQEFPITTYQPTYFLASSLSDAKQRMRSFCEDLPRPFFALYNAQTHSVHIDRPVRRSKGAPTQ